LMAAHMATFEINLKKEHLIMSGRWHDLFGLEAPIPNWNLDNFLSRVHPEDRDELQQEIQATIGGKKESYSLIYRVIWPDNSIHYISERAKLQKNSSGRPLFVHGAMIDVTPLKQTEGRLHEAIRARNEFISIAAHELRTPLSTLAIHTQLASRQLEKNASQFLTEPTVKRIFESSNRQISQLVQLVDKLLDVSRTMNGGFTLKTERFLLNELIKETVASFQCEAEKQRSFIELSAPSETIHGVWDKHRIQQVLGNLLSNAIKFGNSKPIHVSFELSNEMVVIKIKDQGQGISDEVQERLFERFQKNSEDLLSMGLGLYISKQIIDAHLGAIKVESRINEGTTVRISLPLKVEDSLSTNAWLNTYEN
jgi:signal transduction histidine kinase